VHDVRFDNVVIRCLTSSGPADVHASYAKKKKNGYDGLGLLKQRIYGAYTAPKNCF